MDLAAMQAHLERLRARREQIESLRSEYASKDALVTSLKSTILALKRELADLSTCRQEAAELRARVAVLQEEVRLSNDHRETLKAELSRASESHRSALDSFRVTQASIGAARKESEVVYSKRVMELQMEVDEALDARQRAEATVAELESRLGELTERLATSGREKSAVEVSAKESTRRLEVQLAEAKLRADELAATVPTLQNVNAQQVADIVGREETIVALRRELESVRMEAATALRANKDLRAQVSRVTLDSEAERERLQAEMADVMTRLRDRERTAASREAELEHFQRNSRSLEEQVRSLEEVCRRAESELHDTKVVLEGVRATNAALTASLSDKEAEVSAANGAMAALRQRLRVVEGEMGSGKKQHEYWSQAYAKLLADLKDEDARLQHALSTSAVADDTRVAEAAANAEAALRLAMESSVAAEEDDVLRSTLLLHRTSPATRARRDIGTGVSPLSPFSPQRSR